MKQKILFIAVAGLLAIINSNASADVYIGGTSNIFPNALQNDPWFEINSVQVTNDNTNLYFKINAAGYPASWGSYAIAFVTGPGGCTSGNGTAATTTTSLGLGMNYWVTCPGGGSGSASEYQYNTNTRAWSSTSGATYVVSGQTVSVTVPYSSLNLAAGASFQFDVYSFNGPSYGAIDDLANPGQAATWYNQDYSNSLAETYPNPAPSFIYYDATGEIFNTLSNYDISSVAVTPPNNTQISFTFNVQAVPNSGANYYNFSIALVTGPGGDTNSNPSGALFSLAEGINYWITSYAYGNAQLWQFNTNTLTWTNIGPAIYTSSGNSLTLTVSYASVGLTPGQTFKFDAYTFGGSGNGVFDDLANPNEASTWWNNSYAGNLVETYPLAVYNDTTNDIFTTNAPQFDISSVGVWNDNTNLNFIIDLQGSPTSPNDWGSYSVAVVTGPGGDTNSNGSGYAISLAEGMNYWITCLGSGNPQIFAFNTNSQTWNNIGGASYTRNGNSMTLTVPYASLGLQAGSKIQFDAYTSGSSGSPIGAVDDLANPAQASSYYNIPYTNNLVESYTLTGVTVVIPPAPTIHLAAVGNQLNLSASTVTGVSYYLQTSPALVSASWATIATNNGTGGMITNIISINPDASAFFRYLVH
jgi:hypothetical protein